MLPVASSIDFKPCCLSWGTVPTYGVMHSPDCPELRRIVLGRWLQTVAEEIAKAVPWILMEQLSNERETVRRLRDVAFQVVQAFDESRMSGAIADLRWETKWRNRA